MKKRASGGVVRRACCLVVVTRRAILSLSKEKKERERLPDDAAAAAAVKAALFMTSFGLGGLEGPDPRGGRQSDGQTGGRAGAGRTGGQTDSRTDRRSFSGGFCTSAFLGSSLLYKSTTFPSLEKSAANHTKSGGSVESGRRKATNDGRPAGERAGERARASAKSRAIIAECLICYTSAARARGGSGDY